MLGFLGSARAITIDSDVTTGTTGSLVLGQSFNEIRAVDVTVLSLSDRMTESLTLKGLRLGACDPSLCSALVGARIYDSATQALIMSSDVTVPGGSNDVTVTIPISGILVSGQSYRIGFYVETDPLFRASGDVFEPDAFPYVENTGVFRINSAHSLGSDSFPTISNIFTPQMTIRSRDVTTPGVQIAVSKFFTDSNLDPLPMDQFGNPKVDVVLANGVVRSTSPGQVLVWVNVTNNGSGSFQSLKVNETLPVDWTVHPDWLPAKGAIHVLFEFVNGTRVQMTDPTTITVAAGPPESVFLSIPDISATAAGGSLDPGESILLVVKIDYALAGTNQSATSYPRNNTDTASAGAFTGTSYTGTASTDTFTGFFVCYAKVLGDVNNDLQVDLLDVGIVAYAYDARPEHARWNPDADTDKNNVVNLLDLAFVAYNYGTTA